MDLTSTLEDCLQRLKFGETVESCLAHYPDQAAELQPMLAAAMRMQELADFRLSNAQRLRAKVALRETLAARSKRRSWLPWGAVLDRTRGFAVATVLAVVLCVSVTVNAVAASQPGDLAYRVRVVIERVPVALQTTPEGQAMAELNVADRRLADLNKHLDVTGQPDETALSALLAGDEAAAAHASSASDAEQRSYVADLVALHANRLAQLAAGAPNALAAENLSAAAERTNMISQQLRSSGPLLPPTASPTPTAREEAPARPAITSTSAPTAEVVSTRTPTATPSASPIPLERTATPSSGEGQRAPTRSPEATETVGGVLPSLRPTGTLTPGWRVTAIVEIATAVAETVTALPPRPTEATEPPRPLLQPSGTPSPGWRITAIVATITALPPITLPAPLATLLHRPSAQPTASERDLRTPSPISGGSTPVPPHTDLTATRAPTARPVATPTPMPQPTPKSDDHNETRP